MERNDIDNEENILHPHIDTIGRDIPFSVPDEYFNNLSEHIQANIVISRISSKENEGGFSLPAEYFATLSDRIQANIEADQWRKSDLASAFNTPDNYFEQAKENILNATCDAVVIKQRAKIKRLIPAVIKYASAACVLIISGLTLYNNVNRESSLNDKLANLPEEAIVNYLISRSDTGDTPVILANYNEKAPVTNSIDAISDRELNEYLDATAL